MELSISPFTPGPQLSDLHTFEVFAEVGVVLLMFSIGVEFSIPDLMQVKWVAIGGGTLGILMSIALALIASWLAGWTMAQGIVVGATISVASTMVMARLLTDRGALGTTYGRVMIGITLVEDLAVVFMTVVLPVFNGPSEGRLQKIAWTLGKAALLLVPLAFLAITVVPRLLRRARQTKDPEIFLLVAIAICLSSAALAQTLGFSVALGAFLAGVSISGSADLHEAHTTLMPLRDAFVAMFFVSLGTLVVPTVIVHNLATPRHHAASDRLRKIRHLVRGDENLPLLQMDRHRRRRRTHANRRALLHPRGSRAQIRNGRRRDFHRDSRRITDFDFPECVYRARCAEVGGTEAARSRTRYRSIIEGIARLKIKSAPLPRP